MGLSYDKDVHLVSYSRGSTNNRLLIFLFPFAPMTEPMQSMMCHLSDLAAKGHREKRQTSKNSFDVGLWTTGDTYVSRVVLSPTPKYQKS